MLWDIVGDNLLNRISSDFGKKQQGYFRIDPLFNPLYMGYSESKGVVYKFKINGQYAFNDNIQLSAGIKGGYSFRQHRFYYSIPVRFNYNTRHEGYLQLEIGNGNRINTNKLARWYFGIHGSERQYRRVLASGDTFSSDGKIHLYGIQG